MVGVYIQISPRKKALCFFFCFFFFLFFFFAAEHPSLYFAEGFPREISRTNSAKVRRETPRHVADKLRKISKWAGKDLRFLHANNEDSDQTEKISECPACYESPFERS